VKGGKFRPFSQCKKMPSCLSVPAETKPPETTAADSPPTEEDDTQKAVAEKHGSAADGVKKGILRSSSPHISIIKQQKR
jgi:hypothetical protein